MTTKNESLIDVDATDVHVVTPNDPLVINDDPANFGDVEIAGGDIIVQVKSTVSFASLKKTS
ncbi:hypothetical protein [Paraburkholderia sp. J12]|uniref:hypothetical protein n=1 Tax=Paraburkholderia sp. J12 TaxID=2805432 RepID=UPI002ABDA27B|nr:hypothetical protein [Paraburkholderia sp. J12]